MRGQRIPQTEIMSIFGICEAAAANLMVEQGKLRKIPQAEIPETALYTVDPISGHQLKARFAVVVPREYKHEFEELCKDMRA